jgi:hypothetical protein
MSAIIQKTRYRIVLDLDVYDDLDPQQIDWHNILKLEGDEDVSVTVKNLDDYRW